MKLNINYKWNEILHKLSLIKHSHYNKKHWQNIYSIVFYHAKKLTLIMHKQETKQMKTI